MASCTSLILTRAHKDMHPSLSAINSPSASDSRPSGLPRQRLARLPCAVSCPLRRGSASIASHPPRRVQWPVLLAFALQVLSCIAAQYSRDMLTLCAKRPARLRPPGASDDQSGPRIPERPHNNTSVEIHLLHSDITSLSAEPHWWTVTASATRSSITI